ncbi:TPA: hypothetical protein DF272_00130 [Candidatus Falkowbacteria bacterium]|nr:hypothetical protein [Candidatus Falkowbacteria bacterium]
MVNTLKFFQHFRNNPALGKYFWLSITLLVIDRLSKSIAIEELQDKPGVFFDLMRPVIFGFRLSFNENLALSIPLSQQVSIVLSAIIIFSLIIIAAKSLEKGRFKQAGWWWLLLLFAASNLYDRIIYTGVIDFIYFELPPFKATIFNLADIGILIALFQITIKHLFNNIRE